MQNASSSSDQRPMQEPVLRIGRESVRRSSLFVRRSSVGSTVLTAAEVAKLLNVPFHEIAPPE
jgi:hypothetical protein